MTVGARQRGLKYLFGPSGHHREAQGRERDEANGDCVRAREVDGDSFVRSTAARLPLLAAF
jgi:hypothetical protein